MRGRHLSWLAAALVAAPWFTAAASAQATGYSKLQRNPNVLQGTIAEIAKEARTLVLVEPDGRRRTIHFDEETVVFSHRSDSSEGRVVPGTEAAVRCTRKIVEVRGKDGSDVCPMLIFADSVYLASN